MDRPSPPLAATPHHRQEPARASSDSRLCSLPVDVLHRVLDHLLLPALLALSQASKRYHTLITYTRAGDLFLPDPYIPTTAPITATTTTPTTAATTSTSAATSTTASSGIPGAAMAIQEIHPVFGRLYFTPTNPVSCVRVGSPRGPLLGRFSVRHAYATLPPVRRLTLRIVCGNASNGREPWVGECAVASPHGIRVWDLLEQLTLL